MDAPRLIYERALYAFYGKGVHRRTYRFPDSSKEEFYVFSGKTPVIILPLTPDQKVVAIRQFRYGAEDFVLEIPGGNTRIPGEACSEDVERELLEETGYMPFNGIRHLGRLPVWFDPASFTVSFFPVLALDCKKLQEPMPERTEIMETVLIPLAQWIEMILCGEVCDSKSIATTFLALRQMGFEVKRQ